MRRNKKDEAENSASTKDSKIKHIMKTRKQNNIPEGGNTRKGKQHTNKDSKNHSPKHAGRGGSLQQKSGHDRGRRFPLRHLVEGTIRVTQKGVGYVEVDGMEEDIEIDPSRLNTALDMDRVEIVLYGKSEGRRQGGEVINVLFRNKMSFVGVITVEEGMTFLIPDDQRMYRPIAIPKEKLHGAKQGDKAFATITKWNNAKHDPLGAVTQVLGEANENNAEMLAIALERGFSNTFPETVNAAAEAIVATTTPEEIAQRRDFRPEGAHAALTFTIDPKDAKDFDDALSWKALPDGTVEVGVHIADVSHYVTPGSILDKEAVARGTSVYLVDRTIPMLPERLSNDICSLVPDQDRLTFSAIFTLDTKGKLLNEWFGRTIIHSSKRFTYEDAQEEIDRGKGQHADVLRSLNSIAKELRAERFRNGAIEFEAEEVRFVLDEQGKPIDVYKKQFHDTNRLIEEFMLLANKRVAELIATKDKRAGSVFVYRVHDVPNEDKIRDLREFMHGIGVTLGEDKYKQITGADINAMLEAVRGKAESSMVQMATVRAMAKAVYTTKNIGHFGLGFEYYTHFTSPIRRYPDIMVHRLLAHYLSGKPVQKKDLNEEERLARYASQMEIQAAEAERASIRYKQCEYFASRVGTTIKGTISGVTEWGFYVEDEKTKAEGLVHVRNIPDDFYFFDQKNYRMVGKESGVIYRLGDTIEATITNVDLKKKQIDLVITQKKNNEPKK